MKRYIKSSYDPDALLDAGAVRSFRKAVANDISDAELPYNLILKAMDEMNYFSDWTVWERDNRPVDLDTVYEYVYDYLSSNGEI